MTLADRIDARRLAAARERDPGVNPESVALDEFGRIACEEIAREIALASCRYHAARLDGHQVVRGPATGDSA